MKKKNFNIIVICCCVLMMLFGYFISRNKSEIKEVERLISKLQKTPLEKVMDGTYEHQTKTSFMSLTLEVTVKDHKLTDIKILENEGATGNNVESLINKMIMKNNIYIKQDEWIKGEEKIWAVFISCVDSAISQSVIENGKVDISE